MKKISGFSLASYKLHQSEELEMAQSFPTIITAPNSIDCLRHTQMFQVLAQPLVRVFPSATWLTVGDGRFGSDTLYLKSAGAQTVHTSSLTDTSLKDALDRGWIDSFSSENAENLSFEDDTFDFVLCKESYHHFPRPAIALYEMLRVARVGVLLIEPYRSRFSPLGFIKTTFKIITGRKVFGDYEPSGNYIFRVSVDEIRHMARAIDLPAMAWRFSNGIHHPRLFRQKSKTMLETFLFYTAVYFQNTLSFMRLLSPGMVSCVVFKRMIPVKEMKLLKKEGIKVCQLGRNPYNSVRSDIDWEDNT